MERTIPDQLDRSLWPSYSGAIQGQLLGTFRFLGLIDEGHCPTPALRDLVKNAGGRRALLRKLIEQAYSPLSSIDLARASPRQFEEAMRQYGFSGATHRKAMSFFLQAAQFAGMPISALLKERTRTGGAPAHRRAPTEAPSASVSKSVRLRSGGVLTLTAAVDIFTLSEEDRLLVFELVDRLQSYEKSSR